MLEWRDPVMVSQIHIGAMLDQKIDDLLMPFAAIAQDDGFQQGCPAEAIDMIDIDIGVGQQLFDDLDMATVCRRDQTRSAKAACCSWLWSMVFIFISQPDRSSVIAINDFVHMITGSKATPPPSADLKWLIFPIIP